jgi:hypothetical protein
MVSRRIWDQLNAAAFFVGDGFIGEDFLTPDFAGTPLGPPLERVRQRKAGAGRPPKLTKEEIARGRALFRDALAQNPLLRKGRDAAVALLRGLLKLKRKVGDDTLLRHIIRPVLGIK